MASTSNEPIRVERLVKRFGSITAIDDLPFTVAPTPMKSSAIPATSQRVRDDTATNSRASLSDSFRDGRADVCCTSMM